MTKETTKHKSEPAFSSGILIKRWEYLVSPSDANIGRMLTILPKARFMRNKTNNPENTKEILSWRTKETTMYKSELAASSSILI